MKKISIVEDGIEEVEKYKSFLKRYSNDFSTSFGLTFYPDGLDFIQNYKKDSDIIFMDIAMPNMNGMDAALKLREVDPDVCIIFITTLAQFAIKGYEVNAFDFLVKPVNYELFCLKLKKAVQYLDRHKEEFFQIKTVDGMVKMSLKDIYYVESDKHYLVFHTKKGNYRMRESLDNIKDFFYENSFVTINRSLLVNLAHVSGYTKTDVSVNGELLPLSRVYKDELFKELAIYLGGTE